MLAYAQWKGDYLGGSRVRVSKNRQMLHTGKADSDEVCGGRTPPSDADGNDVEVVPLPAGLS